jgi:hypothetical protein
LKKSLLKFLNSFVFSLSILYICKVFFDNFQIIKLNVASFDLTVLLIIIVLAIIKNLSQNIVSYLFSMNFLKNLSFFKFTKIYFYTSILNEFLPHYGTIYKGILFKKYNMNYLDYLGVSFFSRFSEILSCSFLLGAILFFNLNIIEFKILIVILLLIFLIFFLFIKNHRIKSKSIILKRIVKFFKIIRKLDLKKLIIFLLFINISDFLIYFILFKNFGEGALIIILITYATRFLSKNLPIIQISATHISFMTFVSSNVGLETYQALIINLGQTLIILISLIFCYLGILLLSKTVKR